MCFDIDCFAIFIRVVIFESWSELWYTVLLGSYTQFVWVIYTVVLGSYYICLGHLSYLDAKQMI